MLALAKRADDVLHPSDKSHCCTDIILGSMIALIAQRSGIRWRLSLVTKNVEESVVKSEMLTLYNYHLAFLREIDNPTTVKYVLRRFDPVYGSQYWHGLFNCGEECRDE